MIICFFIKKNDGKWWLSIWFEWDGDHFLTVIETALLALFTSGKKWIGYWNLAHLYFFNGLLKKKLKYLWTVRDL